MTGPGDGGRRLVYLGTPEVAVRPLQALVDAGHDVGLVVSRPDKRRGRGGAMVPSPVKATALELGLPVSERVDDVLDAGADLGVVVAFGRIIKPHVIAALPLVNLHFSLLPRWRGAAPVERAILAGDTETGVCLMTIAEALDAGDVYVCERVGIGPDETADDLRRRLVDVGTAMLLDRLANGLGQPVPQEGEPTYAHKIESAELELDWSQPAELVHRRVRAGGAWTTFRERRLKVHRARLAAGPSPGAGHLDGVRVGTGDGVVELVEVQAEGRPRQEASAWARGARAVPGERLGR